MKDFFEAAWIAAKCTEEVMKKIFKHTRMAGKGTYEILKNSYNILDGNLKNIGQINTGIHSFIKALLRKNYPSRISEDRPAELDWDCPESDEKTLIEKYEEKLKETEIPDQEPEPEVINLANQDIESNTVISYGSKDPSDRIADWDGDGSGAGHPPRTIDDIINCAADGQNIEDQQDDSVSENGNEESNTSAEEDGCDSSDSDSPAGSISSDADGIDSDSSSSDSNSSSSSDMDMDADFDGDASGSSDGGDFDSGSDSDADFDMDFDGGGDAGGDFGGDSSAGGDFGGSGGDYDGN